MTDPSIRCRREFVGRDPSGQIGANPDAAIDRAGDNANAAGLHVCMSACLHEIISHRVELDACDSTHLIRSNMHSVNEQKCSRRAMQSPLGQCRCATDIVEKIVPIVLATSAAYLRADFTAI
ncbi:hypothetical protein VDQ74_17485 [Xanthomonas campestris pv. campestris]|nr:hypothetical protein [Xanthomonas campestris pv. campestris]